MECAHPLATLYQEVAMSENYVGIDLHTKSSQLGVIDHQGQLVAEAKLPNDLEQLLTFLQP